MTRLVAGGDRGAAALLTLVLALALTTVTCTTALLAGGVLGAADRARVGADAAALAVLAGSPLAGGDGRPDLEAGRAVARANGVALVAVDDAGWPLAVVVTVAADVPPAGAVALPALRARAAARLTPPD